MPLYIKLDFGEDGKIHAWTSKLDNFGAGSVSKVWANTPKQALMSLARKLGTLK